MPRQQTSVTTDAAARSAFGPAVSTAPMGATFQTPVLAWDQVPLGVYQGDDARWLFRLKSEGNPFDLTGYTVALQFRTTVADADRTHPVTPHVEITDAVNGEVTVTLNSELSRWMSQPQYVWDLEITQIVGSWTTTVARGTLTVIKEITRLEEP